MIDIGFWPDATRRLGLIRLTDAVNFILVGGMCSTDAGIVLVRVGGLYSVSCWAIKGSELEACWCCNKSIALVQLEEVEVGLGPSRAL